MRRRAIAARLLMAAAGTGCRAMINYPSPVAPRYAADAEKQGVKIMAMCELADLVGAIRAFAMKKYGLKLADLHDMAKLTRKAFEQGCR